MDYAQFPRLFEQSSGGKVIEYSDDKIVIMHYIKSYLQLSNDVIKSVILLTENNQNQALVDEMTAEINDIAA